MVTNDGTAAGDGEPRGPRRGPARAARDIGRPAEVDAALRLAAVDLQVMSLSLSRLAEWHYEHQDLATDDTGSRQAGRLTARQAAKYLNYASYLMIDKVADAVDIAWECSKAVAYYPGPPAVTYDGEARGPSPGLADATRNISEPAEVDAALRSATVDLGAMSQSLSRLAEWHFESQPHVEPDDAGSRQGGRQAAQRAGKYLYYASCALTENVADAVDIAWNYNRRTVWHTGPRLPETRTARRLASPSQFGAANGHQPVDGLSR